MRPLAPTGSPPLGLSFTEMRLQGWRTRSLDLLTTVTVVRAGSGCPTQTSAQSHDPSQAVRGPGSFRHRPKETFLPVPPLTLRAPGETGLFPSFRYTHSRCGH